MDERPRPPVRPLRTRRRIAILIAGMLVAGVIVAAAVLIQQNVTTSPSAVAPDVLFQAGDDYSAVNTLGFATLTIGTSGTSATLAVSGVPGAASVALSDILKLYNQDATQAYNVTLSRSAAPNAAITGFTVDVKTTGGATVESWNAATTATSDTFALAANTTYILDFSLTIADGTAAGALGSFTIQVQLAPV